MFHVQNCSNMSTLLSFAYVMLHFHSVCVPTNPTIDRLFTCKFCCLLLLLFCLHTRTRQRDRTSYLHTFILCHNLIYCWWCLAYKNDYHSLTFKCFARGKSLLIVSVKFAISFNFFFGRLSFHSYLPLLIFWFSQFSIRSNRNCTNTNQTLGKLWWIVHTVEIEIVIFSIQNFRKIQLFSVGILCDFKAVRHVFANRECPSKQIFAMLKNFRSTHTRAAHTLARKQTSHSRATANWQKKISREK